MRSTLTAAVLLTLAAIVPAQRTASPRSNILARARGTAVISMSSSYGGSWTAANLADGSTSTGWSSAKGAAFPHTVVFELPQPHAIISIAVDNTGDQEGSYPGISSRRVAVYGSSTSITAGFTQLSAFEARRGGRMEVTLGAPVTARWLKFVVSSNWGNAEYTEVMELEAYGEPVGPPQRVDVTVPDAALRGLTALRDSGYQAAVASWTIRSAKDPVKRQHLMQIMSSMFAQISPLAGAVRGYDIVRVEDESAQSKRIYALLVYERLPIYLMLHATSAGGLWEVHEVNLNFEGDLVFSKELLEGTPLPERDGQVPDVALRGLQALREGHDDVAVGMWTTTWPKEEVKRVRADLAKVPKALGRLNGYEVVRVFELTPHLRRIYARLDYEQGPLYLTVAAYRSGTPWQVPLGNLEFSSDAKRIFPPLLLATSGPSTPALLARALGVRNFAFLQMENGPERNPAPYKLGDRVVARYLVGGLTADATGRFHVQSTVTPFDPGGLPLYTPTKNDLVGSATDASPPGGRSWFDLPPYAPPGTYKLLIAIHDAVKNADAEFEQRFTVEGPKPEPFRQLEVRDFRLSLSKDGPAERHPVLQRGGTIYTAYQVGGMAFRGDRPDVHIALRLVGPDGKVLQDAPEQATIDEEELYHPLTFFASFSSSVNVSSDFAPGTYVFKYTLVDRVANKTANYEARFEVR